MEKIKGIILRTVKYGDSNYIVDMFTKQRGRMSFVMKRSVGTKAGVRRTRVVPSMLIPLSMLEFDCDIHGQGKLPYPKDVRSYYSYLSMHTNPVKATISMFLAECLDNVLFEETENSLLYQYIEESLQWFDYSEKGIANFHLVFLIRLTRFVGIYPCIDCEKSVVDRHAHTLYYDLMNSEYRYGQPPHSHFLRPEEAVVLPTLFNMNYNNMHLFRMNRSQRRRCIEVIVEYYRLHLSGFRELKSLNVLLEVFD